MERTVKLGTWDLKNARDAVEGREVVTPNESAATALGVPHRSLDRLSREILGEETVVHPARALRFLREVVDTEDPAQARAMLPAIREFLRAGASGGTDLPARAQRLMDVVEKYRGRLRAEGLVDPAEALLQAASLPQKRSILLWGYPRLGADELKFVNAVAGEGSVVLLPFGSNPVFAENQDAADKLEAEGWKVVREHEPSAEALCWRSSATKIEGREYPHLEAEVRGALAEVKELLDGGADMDEIALVARDDAFYGPTVLAVAREYGVPVRAFYRVPVAETRVGDWVMRLLDAAEEGFPFEPTFALFMHPLGPGLPKEARKEALMSKPKGTAGWRRRGVDLEKLLPSLPLRGTREEWSGWLGDLLRSLAARAFADHPPEAREPEPPRAVRDRTVFDAMSKITRLFGAAGTGEEELPRARFVEEVRDLLGETSVPAHPARVGVALRTPLMLYGARYRFVFALGLVDGLFPAAISDDPMLDFREREELRGTRLHLETALERARRERLSFWTMLQAPEERLSLSFPSMSENRQNQRSPYFELLEVTPVRPKTWRASSPEEARRAYLGRANKPAELEKDAVLAHAGRARDVERRRESKAPFDEYDGVVGGALGPEGRRFSASQLSDLAECGFKWWSKSVLRLKEPGELAESPALFGNLYHKALELAAKKANRRGSSLADCLEEAFEEAEREFGVHGFSAWGGRRAGHLEMLQAAVGGEDFAVEGAEVGEEVERDFQWHDWRGFRVSGWVDRKDRVAASAEESGGLVLVDYKTSKSSAKDDLQLTIYREAAVPHRWAGTRVVDSYYYSLKDASRIPISSKKRLNGAKLDGLLERLKGKLREGRLAPDVLENGGSEDACKYCSFDPVCRKGRRLERKLGGAGASEPNGEGEQNG